MVMNRPLRLIIGFGGSELVYDRISIDTWRRYKRMRFLVSTQTMTLRTVQKSKTRPMRDIVTSM